MKLKKFADKSILITGGTGSLGQALTKRLLDSNAKTVRVLSRNESKQVEMKSKFNDDRIRYLIGDIRDLPRLERAMEGIDIVFHAAALKHVPIIEYNPFEAIKTNVIGSQNVIDASIQQDVETVVAIGTDKAVSPLNAYGATKLLMEKLFVSANNYLDKKMHKTKFIALRYGNVLGSSGSVIPLFIEQIKNKQKLTITDLNMTRFSITMDQALDFIMDSALSGKGSEVFIPELKSYKISDVKDALMELYGKTKEEIISIRPGEKMHETLISNDEMRYTWKFGNKYVIFNPLYSQQKIKQLHPGIKKMDSDESYSSSNVEMISKEELKKTISTYFP